jgi:DNA-binding MarR family transcriptional regulator
MARTAAGDAATEVVLATFQANGALLAAGNRLAGAEGLTAARWQVLGALALAGRALTVAQVARRMGLARQSVQAVVNRLRDDGLVAVAANPDHRRSPLIDFTDEGRARYAALQRRQARWADALADGLDPAELATAARVLQELHRRLDAEE